MSTPIYDAAAAEWLIASVDAMFARAWAEHIEDQNADWWTE